MGRQRATLNWSSPNPPQDFGACASPEKLPHYRRRLSHRERPTPTRIEPSKVEAPVAPAVAAPKINVAPTTVPTALTPSKPATPAPPPAVVTAPKLEAVLSPVATIASSPIQSEPQSSTPIEALASPMEVKKEISTEELKLQAARLQEQLNALLFREAAAEKVPPALADAPVAPAKEVSVATELAEKVLEFTEPEVKPAVVEEPAKAQPTTQTRLEAKQTSILSKAAAPISLPVEEVKIPSWLAPLARETENTREEASAAPDATTGTVSTLADAGAEGAFQAGAEETAQKSEAVIFGGQLLGGTTNEEAPSGGSKKGLFLGLAAAAALLIGGGVWYGKQPGNFLATSSGTPQAIEKSQQPLNESSERTDAETTRGGANTFAPPSGTATKSANAPASIAKNTAATPASTVTSKTDTTARNTPPVEEPKKPALGDVRLATPNVSRTEDAQGAEAAPSIESAQATPSGDTLAGIAGSHTNGPVAPLPVGGDVKPAHLLKSTPPVYPATARSQRVSGDVTIDALIDASGVVTSTKIISGPTLLHQAAVNAVKQWQYEPAQLDGKPTAMHLTVTVQFHLK